jgi:hypothetical protein
MNCETHSCIIYVSMSLDIDVLPGNDYAFTFGEVADLANKNLSVVLGSCGLNLPADVTIVFRDTFNGESDITDEQRTLPMLKTLTQDSPGRGVAYQYRYSTDPNSWCVMYVNDVNENSSNDTASNADDMIQSIREDAFVKGASFDVCSAQLKKDGQYWTLSTYAQEYELNAVGFMCLAAAFAELSNGLVVSDDCGHYFNYLPASGADVLTALLLPANNLLTQHEKYRDYVAEIKRIIN